MLLVIRMVFVHGIRHVPYDDMNEQNVIACCQRNDDRSENMDDKEKEDGSAGGDDDAPLDDREVTYAFVAPAGGDEEKDDDRKCNVVHGEITESMKVRGIRPSTVISIFEWDERIIIERIIRIFDHNYEASC